MGEWRNTLMVFLCSLLGSLSVLGLVWWIT